MAVIKIHKNASEEDYVAKWRKRLQYWWETIK